MQIAKNKTQQPMLLTNFLRSLSLILGIVVVWLVFQLIKHPQKKEVLFANSSESNAKNTLPFKAFKIPAKLDFAGDVVPLDSFDVYESLDRELLTLGYWQSQVFLYMKRANRYFPVIEPILKKYNIPDDFKYISVIESGLTNAVSSAGATGIWQFMESTAKDFNLEVNKEVDERYHLEKATEAACKYFSASYKKYGDWALVAAAYNFGHGNTDKQLDRQGSDSYYDLNLNTETARYVFRILATKLIFQNPQEYGYEINKEDLYEPISTYTINISEPIPSLAKFAAKYKTSYKMLKLLNPWLRDSFLTNKLKKTYTITLPNTEGRKRK